MSSQIFTNKELGLTISTFELNHQFWFSEKDASEALGADASVSLMEMSEAERISPFRLFLDCYQISAISEFGIYFLTIRAKTSNARKFGRWLINDVLPSLRAGENFKNESVAAKESRALEYRLKASKLKEEAEILENMALLALTVEGAVSLADWINENYSHLDAKQRANKTRTLKNRLAKKGLELGKVNSGQNFSARPSDINKVVDEL